MPIDVAVGTTLHFTLPVAPVARVLHQIRVSPFTTRTDLRDTLGYSQPSITRHVAALTEAGLVEEVPASRSSTSTGRPRTSLGLDGRHLIFWGAQVGVRSSVAVITDAAGRILRHETLPWRVHEHPAVDTINHIATSLRQLARDLPAPTHIGVAFSAHVDLAGHITSADYGWENIPVAQLLADACGQPVDVATGVTAMAAVELLGHPLTAEPADNSSTLYFYAREVVTHAWMFRGGVHRPHSGTNPSYIRTLAEHAHFPTVRLSEHIHPLSNTAVVHEARHRGIEVGSFVELVQVAENSLTAREVLNDRAELLGEVLALAIDIVDPESVVFAGEAFTADPEGLKKAIATVHRSQGAGTSLRIQRADHYLLHNTARLVALYGFWHDPLKLMGIT